ncbi:hypothetical protein M0813_25962 [Anaeramoeba flamelloides]|uniref:L domain-like protein n=1 Tax=Anaeramoeba flamelloides TaxID=1746091 RepID=A0ABQ8Y1K1_9EUKA|nr:hypothetical protein M0813_25962 [Anaeramoeba flamelloides]
MMTFSQKRLVLLLLINLFFLTSFSTQNKQQQDLTIEKEKVNYEKIKDFLHQSVLSDRFDWLEELVSSKNSFSTSILNLLNNSKSVQPTENTQLRATCQPTNVSTTFSILEDFYRNTSGFDWKKNNNWLNTSICFCDWYGISCSEGCSDDCNGNCSVRSINLNSNPKLKLNGNIGEFCELKTINLNNNGLKTLPTSFKDLKELEILNLNDNFFNYFPQDICDIKKIQIISFSNNLINELPDCFNGLNNLN